jgi:class 3 adenylate cyclase
MPTEGPRKDHLERKLAAILAADIAGYSALMEANEEATVRDLKAHQAVILPMIAEHRDGVTCARLQFDTCTEYLRRRADYGGG